MARVRQWRFEHGVTTVSSLPIAIGCGAGHLYASCEGIAEDDSTAMSLLVLSRLLPLTFDFQQSTGTLSEPLYPSNTPSRRFSPLPAPARSRASRPIILNFAAEMSKTYTPRSGRNPCPPPTPPHSHPLPPIPGGTSSSSEQGK